MKEKKKEIKSWIENGEFKSENIIRDNKDIRLLFLDYNPEFYSKWADCFCEYIKGNWEEVNMGLN